MSELERGIAAFRRQVELISNGDYEAALAMHDPEVEIVTRDPNVAIVGVWRGPAGHRELLAEWDAAWRGNTKYDIEEIVELGDRFMAVATYRAIGIESGVEVQGTFYWLCQYRDGKLLRWETFTTREQALAVGTSDQAS